MWGSVDTSKRIEQSVLCSEGLCWFLGQDRGWLDIARCISEVKCRLTTRKNLQQTYGPGMHAGALAKVVAAIMQV